MVVSTSNPGRLTIFHPSVSTSEDSPGYEVEWACPVGLFVSEESRHDLKCMSSLLRLGLFHAAAITT